MSRVAGFLVGYLVLLTTLTIAGPVLIALTNALAPLVVAVGLVATMLRLVWHYTGRDR